MRGRHCQSVELGRQLPGKGAAAQRARRSAPGYGAKHIERDAVVRHGVPYDERRLTDAHREPHCLSNGAFGRLARGFAREDVGVRKLPQSRPPGRVVGHLGHEYALVTKDHSGGAQNRDRVPAFR